MFGQIVSFASVASRVGVANRRQLLLIERVEIFLFCFTMLTLLQFLLAQDRGANVGADRDIIKNHRTHT